MKTLSRLHVQLWGSLRVHWVIALIVGASLFAGAVCSVVLTDAAEPLITVLTADVLVASLAIFAAAVAAAIYAKPAYDQAIESLRPADIEMVDFQLSASDGTLPRADTSDGLTVFRVSAARPHTLKLSVTITNVGAVHSLCAFNLKVPVECLLQPRDPAKVQHEIVSVGKVAELTPSVTTRSQVSAAEGMLYRGYSKEYNAEITLPDGECPWESGWPMRLCCFGPNEPGYALDFAWWVS
jgi:hypothetical protein